MSNLPIVFISHGYIPIYFQTVGSECDKFLEKLSLMGQYLESKYEIKNIIAISGKYCRPDCFKITSSPAYKPLHDHPFDKYYYYERGFKGNPQLADHLGNTLRAYNFEVENEEQQFIDSAIWGPLKVMFPNRDIPIVCISVHNQFDGELHFKLGQLISKFRKEECLIMCFGGVTQNIQVFYDSLVLENKDDKLKKKEIHKKYVFNSQQQSEEIAFKPAVDTKALQQFDSWVRKVAEMNPKERSTKVLEYHKHPHYNYSHSTSEHFMPFIFSLGAAGNSLGKCIHSQIFQQSMSLTSFLFEELKHQ